MSVRLILADDHKIMREGLRALLARQKEIEVIAEAESGRGVVELCAQLHPDVVVIDISMPDLNGIDATRQIVRDDPHVKVIALSMHSDKKYVKEMLSAGACGYLLKDAAFEELGTAIVSVLKNKTYLSPQITDTVVKDYVGENAPSGSVASTALSVREREVLQLLAEGKATREIAATLYVSVKTVETHRKQIMDKLGLNSIAELTKYAIREGLTSIE
jgi:two-component system, NarL family, response regulator NreC